MIKLASWNVNSLKVRLGQVLDWLRTSGTDILALQETKLIDENFPVQDFKDLGFQVAFTGQKTYNGVALISRNPIEEIITDVEAFDDPQRRVLAGTISGIRVINLYVPNGSEVGSEKYHYKLTWLEAVTAFIAQQLGMYSKLAVVGDFNIAPTEQDVHDPKAWEGSVLVSPAERDAFQTILALGLQDSYRDRHPETPGFSWWDYRAAAFRRNLGLRIDHVLLSDALSTHCIDSDVDVEPRRSERPSDHAPVWVSLD